MKKPTPSTGDGFAEEGQPHYAVRPGPVLRSLSDEQKANLEAAIEEADRGDVVDTEEVFARLALKYGVTLDE